MAIACRIIERQPIADVLDAARLLSEVVDLSYCSFYESMRMKWNAVVSRCFPVALLLGPTAHTISGAVEGIVQEALR